MRRVFAVIAATALLACGGDTEPTATPLGPAVGLSISPPGLSLIVGEYGVLAVRAFDSKDRRVSASFEWSSADPTIASVGRTDGIVTAIAAGTTTVTVTAGTLSATASVSVRPPNPPFELFISPAELTLVAGAVERLSAQAYDVAGKLTSASIEWSSADPGVATVGKTDGIVTAIAVGSTTVTAAAGVVRASATVRVEPDNFFVQWAIGAVGSTEFSPTDWSAMQATGEPNVTGCTDDFRA